MNFSQFIGLPSYTFIGTFLLFGHRLLIYTVVTVWSVYNIIVKKLSSYVVLWSFGTTCVQKRLKRDPISLDDGSWLYTTFSILWIDSKSFQFSFFNFWTSIYIALEHFLMCHIHMLGCLDRVGLVIGLFYNDALDLVFHIYTEFQFIVDW